jgi:hypothetical protein
MLEGVSPQALQTPRGSIDLPVKNINTRLLCLARLNTCPHNN